MNQSGSGVLSGADRECATAELMCYDADMKRTSIVVPDDLAALLERERRRRGISTAAIVREALVAYFGGTAKALPFIALDRIGHRHTGREMEQLIDDEWILVLLKGTDTNTSPRVKIPGGSTGKGASGGGSALSGKDGDKERHHAVEADHLPAQLAVHAAEVSDARRPEDAS